MDEENHGQARCYRDVKQTWNPKSPNSRLDSLINKKQADLELLIFRWSKKNRTSVASWSEFGLLLENVAILTIATIRRYPRVEGGSRGVGQKEIRFLDKTLSNSRYSPNKATYLY